MSLKTKIRNEVGDEIEMILTVLAKQEKSITSLIAWSVGVTIILIGLTILVLTS